MRISEMAEHAGVATSTVRYYERIGLIAAPPRTESGYRDYDDEAAAQLLFVARARKMGIGCDQIADLLPIWDGVNCAAARDRLDQLIVDKQAEISAQVAELEDFAAHLDAVRASLRDSSPPPACRTDLSCCLPEAGPTPVTIVTKS